ncbi:hypothetical protein BHM03_00003040 [Ensete ventricosum]|nr:hypothetical protein BHM03_00003040 [Ensete ventricosum]
MNNRKNAKVPQQVFKFIIVRVLEKAGKGSVRPRAVIQRSGEEAEKRSGCKLAPSAGRKGELKGVSFAGEVIHSVEVESYSEFLEGIVRIQLTDMPVRTSDSSTATAGPKPDFPTANTGYPHNQLRTIRPLRLRISILLLTISLALLTLIQ